MQVANPPNAGLSETLLKRAFAENLADRAVWPPCAPPTIQQAAWAVRRRVDMNTLEMISEKWSAWRRYRAAVRELSQYSDDELSDIGICRCDIEDIVRRPVGLRTAATPHIVVVGGGVAGLILATRLGHLLGRRGLARVSLIDRSWVHVWTYMDPARLQAGLANSGPRVTTADVYPASLCGLNDRRRRREPRWIFARFHLNGAKALAEAMPVQTPGSGSDGVTVSPSSANRCNC